MANIFIHVLLNSFHNVCLIFTDLIFLFVFKINFWQLITQYGNITTDPRLIQLKGEKMVITCSSKDTMLPRKNKHYRKFGTILNLNKVSEKKNDLDNEVDTEKINSTEKSLEKEESKERTKRSTETPTKKECACDCTC